MKKILCCLTFLFVLLTTILSTGGEVSVNASSSSSGYNLFGLGKSVNVAKDTYLDYEDINSSECIFDSNWLNSQLEAKDMTVSETNQYSTCDVSTGISVIEMISNMNAKLKFKNSIDVPIYEIFNLSLENRYELSTSLKVQNKKYQFYYNYSGYYPRYFGNLQSDSSYSSHLDQSYEGYLNLLFRGAITPQVFFDKFGTHVITSAVYGGRYDLFYYSLNNERVIDASVATEIFDEIDLAVSDEISGSAGYSFNFATAIGYTNIDCEEDFVVEARGGDATGVTSINNLNSQLTSWVNTLSNATSSLINITEGGLVPLWDLLPDRYLNKKLLFKEMCQSYITANCGSQNSYDFQPNLGNTYTGDFTEIRTEEYLISKNNPFDNTDEVDCIDLNKLTHYGFEVVKSEDFTTLKVELKTNMREKNYGYQHIYLHNSVGTQLGYIRYELGGTDKVTTNQLKTFEFNGISINDIPDGILYVRYGSDGFLENDWYTTGLTVKVTYTK